MFMVPGPDMHMGSTKALRTPLMNKEHLHLIGCVESPSPLHPRRLQRPNLVGETTLVYGVL